MIDEPMTADSSAERIHWGPGTGIAITVWAALGLAAAFTLAYDKVQILIDPTFEPGCNFNPVLACGSVMVTDQASAFGFPNPFLGLIGFSVMLTVGVLLASGTVLPRWVMAGAALGTLAGAVFIHWLAFESLYRIGALCPWCMVVWAITLPMALWFLLKVADLFGAPAVQRVAAAVWSWRFTIVALWYLGVLLLILIRFWDYWSTLI